MKLPEISHPIFEVKLLSQDKPVQFRPFLVKEQKIMMMAIEAKDINTTVKAVKQIINNCLINKIDVDDLPLADIETLFLNLRGRSMGEILNTYFKCTNMVPDIRTDMASIPPMMKECGMLIEVPVNVLEVPLINKDTPRKIMMSDTVGVIMRYPPLSMIDQIVDTTATEVIYIVAAACIETVFDGENVYNSDDASAEEMVQFVENLPADKFELIADFIDKVPKSRYETNKVCPKCKYEHTFVLEGLSDFFT
jgi:hypothetical protein